MNFVRQCRRYSRLLIYRKQQQMACHSDSKYSTDHIDSSESHFEKILISNRGEIACRVMRTARKMGIKTVAVYSAADSDSLHVRLADEAVCIGEVASRNSYLQADRIHEAIERTGAQAVHPGYGFLSENADFVRQLESRGISFIGPSAEVLSVMGDKLASKRLAHSAGVSAIPGYESEVGSPEQCVEVARQLGYPVMIKALAGGGGRGMRVASNDHEAREGFRLSLQEAASSFGDNRMLVEKYIQKPRHIEFQVLGDKYGNVIHLYERECSIQRRNQKVIEEAPSVYLSPEQRAEMGRQAVALCHAVHYSSAGTVEFLVDGSSGAFFFLEMNPRLQVEHPTTEAVTGVDLVHQMLRIAKGHPLKLKQEDIPLRGCAIECRVYAENPYRDFGLPSIGRLYTYTEPTDMPNVRCDSGVEEGSDISVHYDPLISKLVCHAETRHAAAMASVEALDKYVIRGVSHNISLLRDILTESRFLAGDLSTNYLPEVYPDGFKGRQLSADSEARLLAAACCLFASEALRSRSYQATGLPQPRALVPQPSTWQLVLSIHGGKQRTASIKHTNQVFEVSLDGEKAMLVQDNINLASPLLPLSIDGSTYHLQNVSRTSTGLYKLVCEGTTFPVSVMTDLAAKYMRLIPIKNKTDSSKTLTSPMPGLVTSVTCKAGDTVFEGQELCIIEAMKMQNSLCASSSGVVKEVRVGTGDRVAKYELLVLLE